MSLGGFGIVIILCVDGAFMPWFIAAIADKRSLLDLAAVLPFKFRADVISPGVGIQLHTGEHDGRLVVPIYTANKNVNASQSSAVIYSDDGGESWNLGESPQELRDCDRETMTSGGMLTESQAVQLNNGDVLLFMRNTGTGYGGKVAMATSKDGGVTWTSIEALDDVPDVYCQLSAIHFNTDNGEYVLSREMVEGSLHRYRAISRKDFRSLRDCSMY